MALIEMPKVGDKVRFIGKSDNCVTFGKVYEIIKIDGAGDALFIDDDNDIDNLCEICPFGFDEWELVTEETPSIHALIANLGYRLHEVEAALAPKECVKDEPVVDGDAVNHPQHYTRGKFETIEVIEHMTQGYADPFVAYCVGNTTKYIDRAPYKHGSPAEDLRKAAWYLTRAADHIEGSDAVQAAGEADE